MHYASVIVNTSSSLPKRAAPSAEARVPGRKVDIVLTPVDCESSLNFAKP
jgi:hypothetical protein